MTRLFIVAGAILAAGVAACAGQIQVGAYAGNVSSGADSGLTSSYISGTAACVGAVFQGNACATGGSSTGWVETNYATNLFAGTTPAPAPTYSSGTYSKTSTSAGQTMTDNGPNAPVGGTTFAMLNDNGTTQNVWASTSDTPLAIPIGVLGVDEAWLMLNNFAGMQGSQDTDVYFLFGTSSNIVSTTVEVQLTNAPNSGTGGQIRAAVSCGTNTESPTNNPAYNNCKANYADGSLASSSSVDGITVLTDNLYQAAYSSSTSANFSNTSGNIQLDDQGFNLSAYAGMYLVGIGVQENEYSGQNATFSLTALSAITLDTAAPEPSTWALLLGGFAAMGIGGFRRRRSAAKG